MSDAMLLGVLRMPIEYDGGPLSPIAQLVGRARQAADRIESDAAEIERLRSELAKANEQSELFERGWYLRGDALEKLQQWADAYPLAVFPEPDLDKAHELLQAGGMTLDSISASNMRYVIQAMREIVDEGLKS